MADLAFPDEATRLAYDVSDLEFQQGQAYVQIDTGYVYQATASGVGHWKVASGPQAARAETAAPSAGSMPLAGGTMTGVLVRYAVVGITASTTQTQGQGPLTGDVNRIATCAHANDTVTLPTPAAGKSIVVFNDGANVLKIYPPTGCNLGAGTNTSTTLAAGGVNTWVGTSATVWESMTPMLPLAGGTLTGDLVISAAKKIDLSALGVADAAFKVVATTDSVAGVATTYLKVLVGATPFYIPLTPAV